MLRKIFGRIPYFEALRAFLEQWGVWPLVGTMTMTVLGAAYSVWAWFVHEVPVWSVPLLLLATVVLTVIGIYYVLLILQYWRAYRLDLPVLGERMIEFSQRFARAINDYNRHNMKRHDAAIRDDIYLDWVETCSASDRKNGWIAEQFGPDLIYFLNEMHRLGVKPPFQLISSIDYGATGFAAYLGYAGKMLKEGRVEELKVMDKEAQWDISRLFR